MFRSSKWERALTGTAVPSQQRRADRAEQRRIDDRKVINVKGKKASNWRLPRGGQ